LVWIVGFIATLYTPLGITGNYSAIVISTIYSSLLHTLVSSVCYTLHQSFPGNRFTTVSLSLPIALEVFFVQSRILLSSPDNNCQLSKFFAATANSGTRLNSNSTQSQGQSCFTTGLFTANQFVLASSPLRSTTRDFFPTELLQ
jgi:hypothetical protein